MPDNRDITGRFMKGTSGNPSGRPKLSEAQKDALERIKDLAQDAPEIISRILKGKQTPPAIKLRCVELLLDRAYGKARITANIESEVSGDFDIYLGDHSGEYWPDAEVIEQDGNAYIKLEYSDLEEYKKFKENPEKWRKEWERRTIEGDY